jgi:uncharacterized protein YcbK (DUF882 family)
MKKLFVIQVFIALLISMPLMANEMRHFFIEGDGTLLLRNLHTGKEESVTYRTRAGDYPAAVQEKVDRLFGLKKTDEVKSISMRLIALLDAIQDEFGEGTKVIQLQSAYRSPTYNEGLRAQGKTVARTSMHMEGMGADIVIDGVNGEFLWEELRKKECCGVGWYGADSVHVDPGPKRFWTQGTAKTKTKISQHNKKLLLRSDRDFYKVGDTMHIQLIRVTDYPILLKKEFQINKKKFFLDSGNEDQCLKVNNRTEASRLRWTIPKGFMTKEKRISLNISLCRKDFPEMPDSVASNLFEVRE